METDQENLTTWWMLTRKQLSEADTFQQKCSCSVHLSWVFLKSSHIQGVFSSSLVPPLKVPSTKKLIQARLGVSRTIYVNVDTRNLKPKNIKKTQNGQKSLFEGRFQFLRCVFGGFGGQFVLKSGLRSLFRAPEVPFSVPPKWLK